MQGSRFAAGSPDCYSPLFQAWAQFEEICGYTSESSRLIAKCAQVQNVENKRRRSVQAVDVAEVAESLGYSDASLAMQGAQA